MEIITKGLDHVEERISRTEDADEELLHSYSNKEEKALITTMIKTYES
jgi:hypothetical protein